MTEAVEVEWCACPLLYCVEVVVVSSPTSRSASIMEECSSLPLPVLAESHLGASSTMMMLMALVKVDERPGQGWIYVLYGTVACVKRRVRRGETLQIKRQPTSSLQYCVQNKKAKLDRPRRPLD
jgi:hypothetical protein